MRFLFATLLFFTCAACAVTESPTVTALTQIGTSPVCAPAGSVYTRTTMYFGLTRPSGSVSEAEWQAFLRNEVTPRFPDGLTVLEADGQYRRSDGVIERERSKVLVILHDETPTARAALSELVLRYKKAFAQESVLWETARVCAAF